MGKHTGWAVYAVLFAASLQACASKSLYFPTTSTTGTYIMKMDLNSGHEQTTLLKYPMGAANPGGGTTGICRLGDMLYWGDQTTLSVHSAKLVNGKLANHNPSFMANLTDPQGVACDVRNENVYVVDSIPGGGLRGVFFRSTQAGSSTKDLSLSGVAGVRSIKIVDGNLWFGADSGIFRSDMQKTGAVTLTEVGLSSGKIYEDFEVITIKGQKSFIFANTYDWGGDGVLQSTLDPLHQNLTAAFHAMKGAGCQRGSEMTWGLAADSSATMLYWVVIDDADPSHVKIMYKNYASDGPAQVAYSAVGSGYGIYFDPEEAHTTVV